MKYILVLQWSGESEADYDALLTMEGILESTLDGTNGFVDGHDIGSGELNIFIHTDRPSDAFANAAQSLGTNPHWSQVRAAFRPTEGDRYEILWPNSPTRFSVK
jgi:hypothetical protein